MTRILYLIFFLLGSSLCVLAKPNVIYILADDLGYGDLSVYGQEHFETPHIDQLAHEGMRFTQHYAGSTVCAPSRCSLLTGKDIGHAAVRGNAEVNPEGQKPMPANTFTMAHLFKSSGYTTGVFGKWGLGAPGSSSEPLKVGFDRFYGYNCQRQAHHYYPYFLWNDNQREILWKNFGLENGTYAPDLIQKEVLDFIEDNKDHPFFCYYALIQPHAEMFAPEAYMEKFRGKYLPESSFEGTDSGPRFRKGAYGTQKEGHAAFAAMVSVMDDYVGEVVEKLKELGLEDDTLIIFSSDNGPHTEAGHDPSYFNSNGRFRGFKRDLYEGGIRIPMIACWPGQIAAESVSDHLSAFWDVLPTMADLLGVETPEDIDGISFLPTLYQQGKQEEHAFMYWEFHELGGRLAVRKGNWKGVLYNVSDPDSKMELYDLDTDPGESNDLATFHPEIVSQLEAIVRSARTTSPVEEFNF